MGIIKVQTFKCESLDIKQLEGQIADPKMEGFFIGYRACHHSNGDICCRGFWNRHKNDFSLGQLAQRLNLVKFVKIDILKVKKNGTKTL